MFEIKSHPKSHRLRVTGLGFMQGLMIYIFTTIPYYTSFMLILLEVTAVTSILFLQLALPLPLHPTTYATKPKLLHRSGFWFLLSTIGLPLIYSFAFTELLTQHDYFENSIAGFPAFPLFFGSQLFFGFFILLNYYLAYWQTRRFSFPYRYLFLFSWNSIFVLLTAFLFTGICWAILFLWGAMFYALKIHFFSHLFSQKIFIHLATGTFFGFGIAFTKEIGYVFPPLRKIVHIICFALLPVIVMISLMFLIASIMSPIDPLGYWALYLVIPILLILFLNGVYQDGSRIDPPYHPLVRIPLHFLLIILPFLPLFCYYYPLQKLRSHGADPFQIYLLILISLVLLYAAGYSFATLFSKKNPWLEQLGIFNIIFSIILLVVFWLMATPFFNIGKIVVTKHLAYVESMIQTEKTQHQKPQIGALYLVGADFSNQDLSFVVFNGTNLSKANFSHAILNYTEFNNVKLAHNDFSFAELNHTEFNHIFSVTMMNFSHATLTDVTFKSSTFFAEYRGARLKNMNLSKAYLDKTQFVGTCGDNVKLPENLRNDIFRLPSCTKPEPKN